MDRRKFLKTGAVAGVGATVGKPEIERRSPGILRGKRRETARLAIIGVGLRGRSHLGLALRRDDVDVVAISDVDPDAIARSEKMISDAGRPAAASYLGDEWNWQRVMDHDDIDGVIIATPWRWHTRMCVAAMESGMYAGTEVPAATSIQECWDLVNVSERTGMPCMILENVNYRRDVMAILNMVRKGLFGEIVHLECGYQHDLRAVKFNNGSQAQGGGVEFGEKAFSEAKWRTNHAVHRNGDLYPTHGLGPMATAIDINRGNRLVALTSHASKTRGLHDYIVTNGGADHPNAAVRFKLGDVITSVVRTQNGESIIVSHDTNLPRPYSLGFRVQGTRGIWMDVNRSIYLEGFAPQHQWTDAAPYLEEHDHPLWKRHASRATGAGHGGMDFFVLHAFVESVKSRSDTPLDAYDAAVWSSIGPLSEASISSGNAPQDIPDFTRGQWMHRKPVFALDDAW